MSSLYLGRLKPDERQALVNTLHKTQLGNCFICEQALDLEIHKNSLDIDHVVPTNAGGKDDASNFALTHASCNRSKQAANLEVARILHRFKLLKEALEPENRSPNLGDILKRYGNKSYPLNFKITGNEITYSLSEIDDNTLYKQTIYTDELSGFRFFFAKLPI